MTATDQPESDRTADEQLDTDRPVVGAAAGPPGSAIFSVERRPGAGLYAVAWLLSVFGVAVLAFGLLVAREATVGAGLSWLGALLLGLGMAFGAAYQVVARRDRPAERFRGPSPPLLFGAYFFLINALLLPIALVVGGVERPLMTFAVLAVQTVGYFIAVGAFVIGTRALAWTEMGLGTLAGSRGGLARGAADVGYAAALMVPVTFGAALLTLLVSALLGTQPESPVPIPRVPLDIVLVGAVVVVLVPIGEEVFFRAYALTAWLRDLGPRVALVRSTLFFTAIHLINVSATTFDAGWRQAVMYFVLILPIGFVLGWLFLRRGLLASISGHVVYNAIGFAASVLAQDGVSGA